MSELKPCPVCGAKAFLHRDAPDGFYMGYSVGCPRFRADDGIHGWSYNDPEERKLTIFFCDSKNDAIEKWNRKVSQWLN